MLFSQLYPICFLFLLTLLHLKLHFGYFPYFFSFYIQLSAPFHDFLPLAPFLLDIFLVFLQYISNFHFYFTSFFSLHPFFWIFSLSFFNICPIFSSASCLSSPNLLAFGYFPAFSSIYIQFTTIPHQFSLTLLLNLDILQS